MTGKIDAAFPRLQPALVHPRHQIRWRFDKLEVISISIAPRFVGMSSRDELKACVVQIPFRQYEALGARR